MLSNSLGMAGAVLLPRAKRVLLCAAAEIKPSHLSNSGGPSKNCGFWRVALPLTKRIFVVSKSIPRSRRCLGDWSQAVGLVMFGVVKGR